MTCRGTKVPIIHCIALGVLKTLKGFWVFKSRPIQLCRKNKTERSAKMIDRTEKPKISLKFAKRAAQYHEFGSKIVQTMNYKLVAYTDMDSLVLANVFGSFHLDLVHN